MARGTYDESLGSLRKVLEGLRRYEDLLRTNDVMAAAKAILERYPGEKATKQQLLSTIERLRRERDEERAKIPSLNSVISKLRNDLRGIHLPTLPQGLEFSRELLERIGREKEEIWGRIKEHKSTIRGYRTDIEGDRRVPRRACGCRGEIQGSRATGS